jgi:hypothetical protein
MEGLSMSTQPEALRLANYFDYQGFFDSDRSAAAELRRLHVMEKRYEAIKRMRWSDLEVIKQQALYGRDFDGHIDAFIAKATGGQV